MADTVARSVGLADPASGRLSPLFSSRGTRRGIGFSLLSSFYENCLFTDLSTSVTACYDHPERAERQEPTRGSGPSLCLVLWNQCLQQRTENVHTLDPVHMLFCSFGLGLFFLVGLFLFVPTKSPVVHRSVIIWGCFEVRDNTYQFTNLGQRLVSSALLCLWHLWVELESWLWTKPHHKHEWLTSRTLSESLKLGERRGCFLSWKMAMVFLTQC